MTLFADPSFFVLLAAALVPAAALGLTGHSLRRYGLAVSLGFLACAFAGNPAQLAGLVAFLVLARAAVLWLAASPGSNARYGLAVRRAWPRLRSTSSPHPRVSASGASWASAT